MRTFVGALAVAAALVAPGCKKKAPDVIEGEGAQNTVDVSLQVVAVSPGTVAAHRPTTVTLVGAGFVPGATARVGTTLLTPSFRSANQLDANLPALPPGVYDVGVTLPDTTDATLAAGLTVRGGEAGAVGSSALDQCRTVVLYFETNSSTLTGASRQVLQQVVPCLQSSQVPLQVQGHADERDTTDYNLALGQRRAQAVADVLGELGVDRQRLVVTSYGEERPAERGAGEAAWAKNRRVEILVE